MPTKSLKSRGVTLKKNIAKYGELIHDGFKGWEADPFLTNAFESSWKKNRYKKNIIFNINRVLKRVF